MLVMLGLAGIGLIMAATAPVGYQDETGFHFGSEPTKSPDAAREREPDLVLSSL